MKDTRIDRRLFLRGIGGVTAGAAAATALSACGTGTSRSARGSGKGGGKTVVVRDSGGSYGAALQKAIYTPFAQETGISVKVLNLGNAPLLAQIKQGRPQCDLINDAMVSHTKYVKQDALDLDRLKSVKSAQIPENQITQHAIGHSYYGQCIAYRWDSGPLPGVLLSRQEVTMSTVWDGRIADLQKQGVPVERQLNGMRRQFSGYAIAKGAANVDNAYKFMDFALRAESQAAPAKAFPSNPSSPLAYAKLSEDERNALAGAPKYYDKGFDRDVDWWLKNESAVTKRWLEWARG
ncbi:extracellular solute-binding protein [Streptomyces collinus]|uniref:extracellular solute-binding protein n=1 Tax=Streptomyces collinus TaxID=42684 RepID=UPI0037A9735E